MRLADKVAIVTGAGQGIWAAIARRFAAEGASVVLADRNAETASAVAGAIAAGGGKARAIATDVADEASVLAMVAETAAAFGPPDVLVNNAGINVFDDPLKLSREAWQRCFAVDLDGVWHGCKAVLPHMLARGAGAIVNIASVHAFQIIPGSFPYPVAKHAVLGLTRALAIEYAPRGLRINAISPGYIDTPICDDYFSTKPDPAAARAATEDMHPVKRLGRPEEIAAAAVFLAADEIGFMIGANLVIDGGMTVRIHDN